MKIMFQKAVLILCAFASLWAGSPNPDPVIFGSVVAVLDGDTVKVLDDAKGLHKIRLLGIDAPEKAQPFGQRSKQHLSNQVFGKRVEVLVTGTDHYGRQLGKILIGNVDANLEQVKAGLAWWYEHYSRSQIPGDAPVYAQAENEARTAQRGLWVVASPVAPWDWRRKEKE